LVEDLLVGTILRTRLPKVRECRWAVGILGVGLLQVRGSDLKNTCTPFSFSISFVLALAASSPISLPTFPSSASTAPLSPVPTSKPSKYDSNSIDTALEEVSSNPSSATAKWVQSQSPSDSCEIVVVVEIDDAPGLVNAPEMKDRLGDRGLSERRR